MQVCRSHCWAAVHPLQQLWPTPCGGTSVYYAATQSSCTTVLATAPFRALLECTPILAPRSVAVVGLFCHAAGISCTQHKQHHKLFQLLVVNLPHTPMIALGYIAADCSALVGDRVLGLVADSFSFQEGASQLHELSSVMGSATACAVGAKINDAARNAGKMLVSCISVFSAHTVTYIGYM